MTVGVPCELQCGSQTQAWGLGSAVPDFLCPACGRYQVASTVMTTSCRSSTSLTKSFCHICGHTLDRRPTPEAV